MNTCMSCWLSLSEYVVARITYYHHHRYRRLGLGLGLVLFHNFSPGPLWSISWSGTLYFVVRIFYVFLFDIVSKFDWTV